MVFVGFAVQQKVAAGYLPQQLYQISLFPVSFYCQPGMHSAATPLQLYVQPLSAAAWFTPCIVVSDNVRMAVNCC